MNNIVQEAEELLARWDDLEFFPIKEEVAHVIHPLLQRLREVEEGPLRHGCTRSHPHEDMDGTCQLKTELARMANELACLRATIGASGDESIEEVVKEYKRQNERLKEHAGKMRAELTQVTIERDKMRKAEKERLKKAAVDFYYWWHNQPGTNTADGFHEWYALTRAGERS